NLGSLLGIFLKIQIIKGLFLSIHYCPNNRIIHIIQNVSNNMKYYYNFFNLTHIGAIVITNLISSIPYIGNILLMYFTLKDLVGFINSLFFILQYPYILNDPDNFTPLFINTFILLTVEAQLIETSYILISEIYILFFIFHYLIVKS
ncbi:CYB protein, partial [Pseudoatta argentina]